MMEAMLVVTVLCLAASTTVLASSVPLLYWKCFRLEQRHFDSVKEMQRQIDTLDEALAKLLEGVGVSPTSE